MDKKATRLQPNDFIQSSFKVTLFVAIFWGGAAGRPLYGYELGVAIVGGSYSSLSVSTYYTELKISIQFQYSAVCCYNE